MPTWQGCGEGGSSLIASGCIYCTTPLKVSGKPYKYYKHTYPLTQQSSLAGCILQMYRYIQEVSWLALFVVAKGYMQPKGPSTGN